MKSLYFRAPAALAAFVTVTFAQAQFSGLGTGLRTYVVGDNSNGQDTHQVQDVTGVSTLSGHSQASFVSANVDGTSVAESTAAFGDLSVNFRTEVTRVGGVPAYSVATSFTNPSAYYYDRVYVQGANVGQAVTVHITGLLTGVTRIDGNNDNQFNTPQGLNGLLDAYPAGGGDSFFGVANLRQGAVLANVPSGSCDLVATVGSFFNLSVRLYGDAQVYDTFRTSTIDHAVGTTLGHFLTGASTTPGIGLIGDSGHLYQPVPEPASLAMVGLGVVGLLRRRSAP